MCPRHAIGEPRSEGIDQKDAVIWRVFQNLVEVDVAARGSLDDVPMLRPPAPMMFESRAPFRVVCVGGCSCDIGDADGRLAGEPFCEAAFPGPNGARDENEV